MSAVRHTEAKSVVLPRAKKSPLMDWAVLHSHNHHSEYTQGVPKSEFMKLWIREKENSGNTVKDNVLVFVLDLFFIPFLGHPAVQDCSFSFVRITYLLWQTVTVACIHFRSSGGWSIYGRLTLKTCWLTFSYQIMNFKLHKLTLIEVNSVAN